MKSFINKAKDFIGLGADEEEMMSMDQTETKKEMIDLTPLRTRTAKRHSSADLDIAIYEPRAYENSIEISARLRQGSPVIVNLKYLDSGEGTRLIDFVCGTAFAIDGHMVKIADSIFFLTPSNITITDTSDRTGEPVSKEGLFNKI